LQVERAWVYEHADQLGAMRLACDPAVIAHDRKFEHQRGQRLKEDRQQEKGRPEGNLKKHVHAPV
jgi:hypothetical protein